MNFGIPFKEFEKRINLLSLAKAQVKKIAHDVKAQEVNTNLSTALDTTFYIMLKKGKYSLYDKEITIKIDFDGLIGIYGKNIEISKQMKPTQTNILRLSVEVKKLMKQTRMKK